MTDILFLLVIYGNHEEVESFILGREADESSSYGYAICDNTLATRTWRPPACADAVVVDRPDNPGYLEGALVALEKYAQYRHHLPDWIFLANTDLKFVSTGAFAVLDASYDASVPVLIAPRISEGKDEIERNPHLLAPRSTSRLAVNSLVARSVVGAYFYLLANRFRSKLTMKKALSQAGSGAYAPHGAMVGFSRCFLETVPIPRNVPLLAEEYVLGEAARRASVTVVFEPRIHVHHAGHGTTGSSVSWRRAKLLRRAFRYIYCRAREERVSEARR